MREWRHTRRCIEGESSGRPQAKEKCCQQKMKQDLVASKTHSFPTHRVMQLETCKEARHSYHLASHKSPQIQILSENFRFKKHWYKHLAPNKCTGSVTKQHDWNGEHHSCGRGSSLRHENKTPIKRTHRNKHFMLKIICFIFLPIISTSIRFFTAVAVRFLYCL